jgi:hypothetical protein
MKLRQNVRHFASKKALEVPGLRDVVSDKLVDLHTSVFLDKAPEDRREERREHLDGFFDATMDMYLAAHGWAEMMEFPADELAEHYDRYAGFFDDHAISIDDPLGEFRPADGVPDAPSTPGKLEDADFENAAGGYEDDVYVETEDGDLEQGGTDEPDDVDPEDSPFAN